jgi:hypothetical protein
MRDIEEYARFKFIKYSSCYNDILKFYVENEVDSKLWEDIPNMNIWLEFGSSIETQISFMSLGLSRSTAIAISDTVSSDYFTPEDAIEWLLLNYKSIDLSPIMIKEIVKIVSFYEQMKSE